MSITELFDPSRPSFGWAWQTLAEGIAVLELLALASVPSVLLRRRGQPTAALAWLLALFSMPGVGLFAWWLFGRTRVERKRRKSAQVRQVFSRIRSAPEPAGKTHFDSAFPKRALGDFVLTSTENNLELLIDGPAFFHRLEADLRAAERSIQLLFYMVRLDEIGERIAQILVERAAEGLTVRLLVDGFGSNETLSALRRRFTGTTVQLGVFLPSRWFPLTAPRVNFINHRKIAIIDSAIAFTGGMNIADEYYRPWRDLMVRIEGYGALALEHVFLEDWYFATGIAVPDPSPSPRCDALGADLAIVASGPDSEPWILDAYFMAVTQAKERVWIATPYFIPNQAMMEAFRTAAGRGVDVRIIVPRSSDVAIVEWASRSYYKDLLEAKVRILEYQGPMLHAKALLCDESLISVGSANMDSRSLKLSFEVACFASDERASRLLHAWLSDLQKGAEEVTVEAMARKTTLQKLAESVAHLLSPVL